MELQAWELLDAARCESAGLVEALIAEATQTPGRQWSQKRSQLDGKRQEKDGKGKIQEENSSNKWQEISQNKGLMRILWNQDESNRIEVK